MKSKKFVLVGHWFSGQKAKVKIPFITFLDKQILVDTYFV